MYLVSMNSAEECLSFAHKMEEFFPLLVERVVAPVFWGFRKFAINCNKMSPNQVTVIYKVSLDSAKQDSAKQDLSFPHIQTTDQ